MKNSPENQRETHFGWNPNQRQIVFNPWKMAFFSAQPWFSTCA